MKISVIVPVYNSASTVENTVLSLLSQSGAEIEVIAVDDGSSDNSVDVLMKYRDRIKIIRKDNGGPATARNIGLDNADGDFVLFVDADDTLKDGSIEKIVQKQRQYDAEAVRFEYVIRHPDGKAVKPLHYFNKEEFITNDEFKEKIYPYYIDGIQMNTTCMTLFKRSLFDGLRFRTDMRTAEDAVLSMMIYSRAKNILTLPDEYYIYNAGENSLTAKGLGLIEKYRCNFKMSIEIIRHLGDWGMKTPKNVVKALARPLVLTVDKIRRMRA